MAHSQTEFSPKPHPQLNFLIKLTRMVKHKSKSPWRAALFQGSVFYLDSEFQMMVGNLQPARTGRFVALSPHKVRQFENASLAGGG